jgi:MFS family permease
MPAYHQGPAVDGLESAIRFAVFGQRTLENALVQCRVDGGRLFISSLSWTLALVFFGSAVSRLRLGATIVRFERKRRPEALGAQPLAFALGLVAVAGFQLLYMGTAYLLLPCRALGGLFGSAMVGIGPLMLAYLISAALTNLLALGPET